MHKIQKQYIGDIYKLVCGAVKNQQELKESSYCSNGPDIIIVTIDEQLNNLYRIKDLLNSVMVAEFTSND